jgi:hypothetical protein
MNAKGYEEYLLLRRAVEALVSEHEKLVGLAAGLKNDLSEARRQPSKFSGAILGSGEDAATARRRVSELVREIDKCIALLDR